MEQKEDLTQWQLIKRDEHGVMDEDCKSKILANLPVEIYTPNFYGKEVGLLEIISMNCRESIRYFNDSVIKTKSITHWRKHILPKD